LGFGIWCFIGVERKRPVSEKGDQTRYLLPWHGWAGLAIILVSEALLFAGVSFVRTFFTPLAWSGYILLVDSLVYLRKGRSLIMSRPGEFLLLLPLSVGFWLIFEFYNLYLQNWSYTGLPEELPLRLLGYGWAFATIWPAILETAEALEGWKEISARQVRPCKIRGGYFFFSSIFGAFCLTLPLVVPPRVAHYLAAPVWLGFIFLLDPINYWRGGDSLFGDWEKGNPARFYSLLLAGLLCGILWEFWNYWAGARWSYTVPIGGHIKIFEMPVLGYLGFPPFAVECFTMYAFVKNCLSPHSAGCAEGGAI
jgi:hypothetical protein